MSEKIKRCAVTGHRILPKTFDKKLLKNELYKLVYKGYKVFLIGMALGFDTECFCALEEIKRKEEIYLVACVPCKNQSDFFNKKQKENYKRMLSNADEIVYIQPDYDENCMKRRNYFLVDNADLVFCYLNKTGGGTYQTVKYAVEKEREIIYFNK